MTRRYPPSVRPGRPSNEQLALRRTHPGQRHERDRRDQPFDQDCDQAQAQPRAAEDRPGSGVGADVSVDQASAAPLRHGLATLRRHAGAGSAERRWVAATAVSVAIVLQASLPSRLTLPPPWLLPGIGFALLVGVVIANPTHCDRRSMALRSASITLVVVMSLANAISAVRLVDGLVTGMQIDDAGSLLAYGVAVWLTNVIVFARVLGLDRGGPAARAHGVHQFPDLLFPQMANPGLHPPRRFVDYLYVSFTNASSFSPADVVPLVRWAKLAMMAQSAVSLGTVALVVARAVNVLG